MYIKIFLTYIHSKTSHIKSASPALGKVWSYTTSNNSSVLNFSDMPFSLSLINLEAFYSISKLRWEELLLVSSIDNVDSEIHLTDSEPIDGGKAPAGWRTPFLVGWLALKTGCTSQQGAWLWFMGAKSVR